MSVEILLELASVRAFIEARRDEDLVCFTVPNKDGSRDLSVMDDAERANIAESDAAIAAIDRVIAALSASGGQPEEGQ